MFFCDVMMYKQFSRLWYVRAHVVAVALKISWRHVHNFSASGTSCLSLLYLCGLGLCPFRALVYDLLSRVLERRIARRVPQSQFDDHCLEDTYILGGLPTRARGVAAFLDGYCSTVQGLLDWFEVDLGLTELLFIKIDLCVMCVFVLYSSVSLSSCPFFGHPALPPPRGGSASRQQGLGFRV